MGKIRLNEDHEIVNHVKEGLQRTGGVVRDMAAESGRLYILDMQCLSGYNMQCRQVTASPQGARAAGLSACDRRVWLVGNGELCRIITK